MIHATIHPKKTRRALKRELVACLRTGRALRVPRARARRRGKTFVTPEIMITQRPAEADDRAMPGHGQQQRVKNGPPLAGHGAQAVRDAIAESITTLPQQLRRSLAWDQGTEMAQHAQLRIDTNLDIYFCDPQSPVAAWHQREHQRSPPPILPQRHRPQQTLPKRPGRRRRSTQQSTPQNPRLEDPRRDPQPTPTLPKTRHCCDDLLNLSWVPWSECMTVPE